METVPHELQRDLVAAIGDVLSRHDLERLLALQLGRKLDTISLGPNMRNIAFELVDAAEREGWFIVLVGALASEYPHIDAIVAVAEYLGIPRGVRQPRWGERSRASSTPHGDEDDLRLTRESLALLQALKKAKGRP